MEPEFGIFEPLFESTCGYLKLLHLGGDDSTKAVALVTDCCRQTGDPYRDIRQLLADPNWRLHLVAAVAVIVSDYDSETTKCLWHCIDRGSWVTPQIGVALYLVDPDFELHSRTRLEAGCPVDVSNLMPMTNPERHSAAGPAITVERSAKAAATLLQLLRQTSPLPNWVERVSDSEDMQSLLAEDFDPSASIADGWLHRIKEITRTTR